jgi:hypothetical protein
LGSPSHRLVPSTAAALYFFLDPLRFFWIRCVFFGSVAFFLGSPSHRLVPSNAAALYFFFCGAVCGVARVWRLWFLLCFVAAAAASWLAPYRFFIFALAVWAQGSCARFAALPACILIVPVLAFVGAALCAVVLVYIVLAEGTGLARILAFLACVAVAVVLAYA